MKKITSLLRHPFILLNSAFIIFLSSCSIQKQIAKSAKADVLDTKALQTAHVGISIFDPAKNKYLFNYQGDKYFVPASNTKLPTCYAAMKYLGDSLVGLRYAEDHQYIPLFIKPTGDPTFLHPDFPNQPVYDFLKKSMRWISIVSDHWKEEGLGSGWSWNDYDEYYMCERSFMPVYGNAIRFTRSGKGVRVIPNIKDISVSAFHLTEDKLSFFDTSIRHYYIDSLPDRYYVKREKDMNFFWLMKSENKFSSQTVPFIPADSVIISFLKDTLKQARFDNYTVDIPVEIKNLKTIYSQPTDSLLKPMMHRSDNFFAEQSLLMVSNERLGVMNDERIIDTLLKTDLKDLPQKPRWVDGSGLSRYNLFTPQDFVSILNKMKNEFGMERIKVILPTGGEGTISSYYKADSGYIYGKTGTLSGVVAFSGFLYTKKGKLLIFSTLVNNHQASATDVRRAIEKFLQGLRNKY